MAEGKKLKQLCDTNKEIRCIDSYVERSGRRTFLFKLIRMTKEEFINYYTHCRHAGWLFEEFPWGLYYEEARLQKKKEKKDYLRQQPKDYIDSFTIVKLSLEEAEKLGFSKKQWLRYKIEYLNLKREIIEEYKNSKQKSIVRRK